MVDGPRNREADGGPSGQHGRSQSDIREGYRKFFRQLLRRFWFQRREEGPYLLGRHGRGAQGFGEPLQRSKQGVHSLRRVQMVSRLGRKRLRRSLWEQAANPAEKPAARRLWRRFWRLGRYRRYRRGNTTFAAGLEHTGRLRFQLDGRQRHQPTGRL